MKSDKSIKDRIYFLQLSVLQDYLEIMMKDRYGDDWIKRVIAVCEAKFEKYSNYVEVVNEKAAKGTVMISKKSFDVSLLTSLMKFDFPAVCCPDLNDMKAFLNAVGAIRINRNNFGAHLSDPDNTPEVKKLEIEGYQSVTDLISYLEKKDWASGKTEREEYLKNHKEMLEELHEDLFPSRVKVSIYIGVEDASGHFVPGCKLSLINGDDQVDNSWTSTNDVFSTRVEVGQYKIETANVVDGYKPAPPVHIQVKEGDKDQFYKIYLERSEVAKSIIPSEPEKLESQEFDEEHSEKNVNENGSDGKMILPKNWRILAAVCAAALILVLVCVGLLHDRAPVVAPVSADELVLSAQEGNADLPVVELSVEECVLDTDTVYSLSSDTQISVLVTNKSKAKGIWFSYGDGNPERLSGTSFTLPDPGSDRTWHPLYVYYQLEDGTEVGKDKSYKISLCEDSNDYDSPLLVSVNGQQLIPNNSSAYPVESDWAVCILPRKGYDVSGFSYSFGGAEQKCLFDGYEVIYPPLQNGGELTLTVTPELASGASQKLSYRLSFAEKDVTEDDSLPEVSVRTASETLQLGKLIELTNDSCTLYLSVPEGVPCKDLCYKIGTRSYVTVEGNICSVDIPQEYAGTGPFSFYVWYITEDNVRKPWVLYNLNMTKVIPDLDVSVRGNKLAEDKTYIIDPEDIVTVQIDSEKEDWTLHYKIGTSETEHISGGNRWNITIPARLTNTGTFSFYVCYENGDGVRSEWQLYVLSAEE